MSPNARQSVSAASVTVEAASVPNVKSGGPNAAFGPPLTETTKGCFVWPRANAAP